MPTLTAAPKDIKIFLLCIVFEPAAWGIAATILLEAMLILNANRDHRVGIPVLVAAPLIFIFATIHLIGVIIRTYDGFILSYGDPEIYFSLLTTPENTAAQAGQVGAILTSDLVSVYRVWLICDRAVNVFRHPLFFHAYVVPALGVVTTLISGAIWLNTQRNTNPHESFYQANVYKWNLTFLAAGLFTTATSTGLIAYTLWKADRAKEARDTRDSSSSKSSELPSLARQALVIFVESAALYSLTNFLYLVFYAAKLSNLHSIFSTISASIASITFSLITIRGESAVDPANDSGIPVGSTGLTDDIGLSNANPERSIRDLGGNRDEEMGLSDNGMPN